MTEKVGLVRKIAGMPTQITSAIWEFALARNPILYTQEVDRNGVHRSWIHGSVEEGRLRKLAPGIYFDTRRRISYRTKLATLARKYSTATFCLSSALYLENFDPSGFLSPELEEPDTIWIARGPGSRTWKAPDVDFVSMSKESYAAGVTTGMVEDVPVRRFVIEKSIADLFKYRKRVGVEAGANALGLTRGLIDDEALLEFAQIDRVERLVRSHLALHAQAEARREFHDEWEPETRADGFPVQARPGRPPNPRRRRWQIESDP